MVALSSWPGKLFVTTVHPVEYAYYQDDIVLLGLQGLDDDDNPFSPIIF